MIFGPALSTAGYGQWPMEYYVDRYVFIVRRPSVYVVPTCPNFVDEMVQAMQRWRKSCVPLLLLIAEANVIFRAARRRRAQLVRRRLYDRRVYGARHRSPRHGSVLLNFCKV